MLLFRYTLVVMVEEKKELRENWFVQVRTGGESGQNGGRVEQQKQSRSIH